MPFESSTGYDAYKVPDRFYFTFNFFDFEPIQTDAVIYKKALSDYQSN